MSDEKYLTVIENIPFNRGTIFVYTKGDRIAESVVKANGWEDYVAAPSTKSAKEASAVATGEEKK